MSSDDKQKIRMECPTCGKAIHIRATSAEAEASELECGGSEAAPHSPTRLVIRTKH